LSAGASAMSLSGSFAGNSAFTAGIGVMGATTNGFFPGVGSLSTSATSTIPTSFNALSLSTIASNWVPYFYLIND
jgi:hypothetical protein